MADRIERMLARCTEPPLVDWDSITISRIGRRRWKAQVVSHRTTGMEGHLLVLEESIAVVIARSRRRVIRRAVRLLDPPGAHP